MPESFKVLVKELQSLGLAVEVLNEEEEKHPAAGGCNLDATHVLDVDHLPDGTVGSDQRLS